MNEIITDKEGNPEICICGCTEFEMCNEYYTEHILCEYDLKCKKCGQIVNYWAYGSWQLYRGDE